MDVYTAQIVGSGQYHDVFYTNANVIAAYKKYINGFVSRYVNEPTILVRVLRRGDFATVMPIADSLMLLLPR